MNPTAPDKSSPAPTGAAATSTESRLAWALAFCSRAQLVMTPARKKILQYLAARRVPTSIELMARSEELHGSCDTVTIYRALGLFKEIDLVRQVGLLKKNAFYVLNAPGAPCHYLICRHCETLIELPCDDPVQEWAQRASAAHGFTSVYHELEIYGVCPRCAESQSGQPRPSKLRIRLDPV